MIGYNTINIADNRLCVHGFLSLTVVKGIKKEIKTLATKADE